MSTPMRREGGGEQPNWLSRMDRAFEDWMRSRRLRPFGFDLDWPGEEPIRVDQFRDGDTEVIRAEIPGIDPDNDVELTVSDGVLRIKAERRVEEKTEEKGYTRRELRYGSFTRTLPLPEGADESSITATYQDGILEVRVPVPKRPPEAEKKKITISKR
jgi:HSP20 family protein